MNNPTNLNDLPEVDKSEWLESIDYIFKEYGEEGVSQIMRSIHEHVISLNISLADASMNTPYINTIPVEQQIAYPGDIKLEKRIENIIRWNAMAMVLQAYDKGTGVGGHIATYVSAATMLEVGFNHFFKASSADYDGDMIIPQPHAAPGIYARAFLEGRLTEQQLKNFRRELAEGGGLCSYPHPRSMPDFWQLPNASMGLSTPSAIYQARFSKYLENRGLKNKQNGKIWCFIGDGESDEPEVAGTINIAARENLDNLVLVINCNLQRLDGPVRGNGKIIQELERTFRGADWNVIKVVWGGGWDSLLSRDHNGALRRRMNDCLDGDYQRYSVLSGDSQREHWVADSPELKQMMDSLTDDELKEIKRGGHDAKKIYAAYDRAQKTTGKPTVILIKTVKGEGMGASAQGRNTVHQKKNFTADERVQLAQQYGIPISAEAASAAEFYCPEEDSAEIKYLKGQRDTLGGYLPSRKVEHTPILAPPISIFDSFLKGSGERVQSSTTAMVRILSTLLKDKDLGQYIVPIVPDEARTFGMDGLFKTAGIYSPHGQNYEPVDQDSLLPYRESKSGQILQEGICETGAMASFMAAGSSYAVHGVPMIPFYIFYSMFGLQRVGDMVWACGDMMSRGFLLGGTAGRTTLNGEGLQHQDGHSLVLASTVPNLISYDPAFGFELALIVREGIRRMYENKENIFYYVMLYNENYVMPAMPQNRDVTEGVLKGGYCFQRSDKTEGEVIHLLSSGAIMQESLRAAELLESLGYRTHVWSITSFIELEREGQDSERWNRLNPTETARSSYVESMFANETGIFIAATDYMKSLAEGISRWIPGRYEVLGTDGYGVSEARPELRDHFEVSTNYIVHSALSALYRDERIDDETLEQQLAVVQIDKNKPNARLR